MSTTAERISQRELEGAALEVYAHDLPVHGALLPMWTCITVGLPTSLQQPELVVTLARGDQPATTIPEALMAALASLVDGLRTASRMQGGMPALRAGMSLALAEHSPPFVARTELRALALFHARPIDGVPISPGSLAVVLMQHAEHTAALEVGLLRWSTRRGEQERAFPTALWTDPRRPPTLHHDELSASILHQMPRSYLVGTSVTMYRTLRGRQIVLDVEPVATRGLAELARRCDHGFAVTCELSPRADACLVWRPGQEQPTGISDGDAAGDRLGLNFLLLGPTGVDDMRLLEDGVGVTLGHDAWARLRAALQSQEPIELQLDDATLLVRFLAGPPPLTTTADEFPPITRTTTRDRVHTEIVLLTHDAEVGRAATPAALSACITALHDLAAAFDRTASRRSPAAIVAVDLRLDPSEPPAFRMHSVHLEHPQPYLDALATHLQSHLHLPRVLAPLIFRAVIHLPATA